VSKKQEAEEHEVVILGSGLGGLIAGALLSRGNRRVLLLKEKRYQPSFVREEYRFIPFSNFSEMRLKHSLSQKISQILKLPFPSGEREGGRKLDRKFGTPKQEVAFQVILPKGRVDLFSQRSLMRGEWKREFPKETGQIEQFYEEMEEILPLLKRTNLERDVRSVFPIRYVQWIKRGFPFRSLPRERVSERLSPFSKEFQKFVQLQLIAWGNLTSDQIPLYLATYLLLKDKGEEWIDPAELERMEKMILERFAQSGGKIEEIEGVEKIEGGGWRKFTLSLKGETRTFRARFLILNSPLHRVSHLMGTKKRKLSRWMEKIRPRYAILPVFLGVEDKAIPVGMRDLLVSLLDLEKPYGGGNLLLLHLSLKGDREWAPEGKRALTVESLVPVEKWNSSSLDEHLKGVMRHLHQLFPFLEPSIEFMDWSWAKGQFFSWSYPHFIYETNHGFKWGDGVIPTRLSRNLYFVGKENYPYLGLEGEVLCGRSVGKQLLEKFKA
jgi:phytoene dehydrogenase-like protein